MAQWKIFKRLGLGALGLTVVAVVAAVLNLENQLPYMLLSHHNFPVADQPAVLQEFGATAETLEFRSADAVMAQGWWIPAKQSAAPTLIVLHNLGGTRQDHLRWLLPLWQKGLNLLLLDLREHGGSGGELFTYGYHEWQDITAAIDAVEKRQPTSPIVMMGISAGGAVAISASARDPRIDGLITIGTFADLGQTIMRQTPWLPDQLRQQGMRRAEAMAQFKIAASSPQTLIPSVSVPQLIAHGVQDDYIPFSDGQTLFAAATGPKQFYPIANANHGNMLQVGGDDLRQRIFDFTTRIQTTGSK